jgi:hypothetical protein
MKYTVIAEYDNAEVTVKTNEINVALETLFSHQEEGAKVMLTDGFTGEIYVTANDGENYIVEEWSYLILGWLMQNAWGEEEPAPAEETLPPMIAEAITEFAKSLF